MKRWIKRVALLALPAAWMLAANTNAIADSKTFTWTPPVARVDGRTLTDAEIQQYGLKCGPASGDYSEITLVVPNTGGTSRYASADVFTRVGDHFCTMVVVTTDTLVSADSNEVIFAVAPPPSPAQAITNLAVE